ncbi:hypothetical protein [Sphingomonas sp. LT1P40]|uniref:hypothetical protein n=1 Tax=Alteristakelama amylovorans TaxID=3096166 RepID=UPI002FC81E24
MNAQTATNSAPWDPAAFNRPRFHDVEPTVAHNQRYDGWTPDRQARFLIALSRGVSVTRACALVGLSRQSAYQKLRGAPDAPFALCWQAALRLYAARCADEVDSPVENRVKTSSLSTATPPSAPTRYGVTFETFGDASSDARPTETPFGRPAHTP